MARIIQTADLTPAILRTMDAADLEWVYNGLDCCVTLEILEALELQLDNTSLGTYNFSRELQAPVLEMSIRGLLVDEEGRRNVLKGFKEEIEKVGQQLTRIVQEGIGVELNWRSPTQLRSLLYDVLQLPPVRKRNSQGKMAPTVNREALERLSGYFWGETICNHLLKLRDLDKKRSFLETEIDKDQRIRANFNIAGTKTGRLASSMSDFGTGTNMQNIDRNLRSVFIADPGMKYANLDLEQADSRNVGALCWNLFYDRGPEFAGAYLDACESGDLHTFVCRMAWSNLEWGDDPSQWRGIADQIAYRNDSYRDLAKKLGHGTNYYGKPATMAKHSKVAKTMIEAFQKAYFETFPAIAAYHEYVASELRHTGNLVTPFGRRRYFFGRANDEATLREAIAYSPQSMTADEIDIGILKLWRSGRIHMMLQVHDSILIQYPEEEEDEIIPWALEQLTTKLYLEGGREFSVPTEAKVGWNYGDFSSTNPDGLRKWNGPDDRVREKKFQGLMNL